MEEFFINEYDGIEIITIDEEEKNMIIRLDNIRKFYDEYCQMKLDKEEIEERIAEAIEYLKENELKPISLEFKLYETEFYEKILSILERGKENEY